MIQVFISLNQNHNVNEHIKSDKLLKMTKQKVSDHRHKSSTK